MSDTSVLSIDDIRTIAVVGAGTMGAGVAHVAALAGFDVAMHDIEESFLERGVARIHANLDKGVARGKVSQEDRDAAVARIRVTTSLENAFEGAHAVIEAAPETLELKQKIFAVAQRCSAPGALLASNTSSLSIARIAEAVDTPERVVGMHFFNPVHIMKLIEVVHHAGTADAATACARALAERFGKTAITVRDAPGFASSRLGLIIGLEAMRMVEQGVASPDDIDTAMKLGYGHPMGPLELTDLVGLDIRLHIADYLTGEIGAAFEPPQILRDKVAAGKLGKKSGEGFYSWKDGKRV